MHLKFDHDCSNQVWTSSSSAGYALFRAKSRSRLSVLLQSTACQRGEFVNWLHYNCLEGLLIFPRRLIASYCRLGAGGGLPINWAV